MRLVAGSAVTGCLILLAACSGGGDESPTDDPASEAPAAAPELRAPVVEAALAEDGDALWAGDGDAQITVTDVSSDGDIVMVTGSRRSQGDADAVPVLVRSGDARQWEAVDVPSDLRPGGSLDAVVSTADGFVAFGRGSDGPLSLHVDGDAVETAPVAFPELAGVVEPFVVRGAAVADDRIFVLGVAVEGSADAPEDVVATMALVTSDDGGTSWTPVELPGEMTRIGSGAALLEMPAPAATVGSVDLVEHAGALVVPVGVEGADGATTTLWRSGDDGEQWIDLGTTGALFANEELDLVHAHGEALLAFTRAGDDAAVWRSDDEGGTFSRLDTEVFGGGGRQSVDAASTLGDGSIAVVGVTEGEPQTGRRPGELELWLTPDLERWERALTDPGLSGTGSQAAAGVVALGDDVVIVGTDERLPTPEEREAFEDSGAIVESPARHGAAWVVALEDPPAEAPGVDLSPLELTGFDGDVTISEVVAFGGGLVAVGWVEGADDDTAAVWRSADGQAWERVDAPAVVEPPGQRIRAVTATDGGLVAVGTSATADGETYLGVWTSADGAQWSRIDLTGSEYQSAAGYDVTETADGLVAVGTSSPDGRDYRDVGIWRSSDGGQTWSSAPTTREPFQAQNVEVLSGVAVSADGTIVAVGHSGEPEDREDGGFTYTPVPYIVESADGETWTVVPSPFDDPQFGDLYAAYGDGDAVMAFGTASKPSDASAGDSNGLALRRDGEWTVSDQMLRHRPTSTASTTSAAGTVVVGEWYRNAAGADALIALERDGELVPVGVEALLAEGDQRAVGAAALDDRVIVLGEETTDDATTVIGWSVTPAG